MGILGNITTQLGDVIKSQTAARKLMLGLVVLVSLGGLGWLILSAQTGSYTVLVQNLQPSEGVEAMAKLQTLGIKAKMENGGTIIKVPQNRFDDAIMLLAMEGIPSTGGTVGYELMDKSTIGQSKFQQEKNYLRMREGELARTLLTIREIQAAKVHLALPEDSLFVTEEKPATASVVLKLQRGARLEERQVTGIVNLVSHGVEGLKPENVSIIDDLGNQLNQQRNDDASQSTVAQQNYKTQYEETLKNRIESMLENVIGKGKVSARVEADFSFATQHQIKQTYNPEEQNPILRTEKMTSEALAGKGAGATGVPGSTSNLLPASVGTGTGSANGTTSTTANGTSRLDRTAEYAVSSTWEETQQGVPTPKQISVAVLVDWAEDKDAQGKATPRARTPEEINNLEELVKAAIGYQSIEGQRMDQVKVLCERFRSDAIDTGKEPWWNTYPMRQYIQLGVQWGIVGLIGLLLILMVLRPAVKQITVAAAQAELKALPAGAAGAIGALPGLEGGAEEGDRAVGANDLAGQIGQLPSHMLAGLPPDVRAALTAAQALGGGAVGDSVLDDLDDSEIPEDLRDNKEAIRQYKLQRLAAKQARLTQAEAQKIHQEVVETARNNPQKTVSLLRQWMDEA